MRNNLSILGRRAWGCRHFLTAPPSSRSLASTASSLATDAAAPTPTPGKPPTAIVLMNMGGPATLSAVHPFLLRLFSDKDLIPLPAQSLLGPWIARRRSPKIEKQYAEIGGGSPIRHWTRTQGEMLETLLDHVAPETAPHKHYIAFRYADPLTEDCIADLKRDGVQRAIAFTQYPQYSCSTTGSNLNELYRKLKTMDPDRDIFWSVIDRWPTHSGLVNAFVENIQKTITKLSSLEKSDLVILFSAHSLPMTVVNRGDPYPPEVAATVHSIMSKLGGEFPYRLVWQSQVGPQPWLGPKTDHAIEGLARNGRKNVLIVPVAFTSDHVETLYEIDIEYGELAKKCGVTLHRCDSLNDSKTFVAAMADLVVTHLANVKETGLCTSNQLLLRCPGCINTTCGPAKAYFSGMKKLIGKRA